MTDAQRAVMTPIVFFDLFDRPIRRSSLLQLSYGHPLTETRLQSIVETLEREHRIVIHRGFVRLADRTGLTEMAVFRDQVSDQLWAEAKRFIARLSTVPFVKMIAVINSLSFHNANGNSDIDLLVVTEPGRMAVARDHITLLLTLWGRRNTRGLKRGKLAPDVFLDTKHLSVKTFHVNDRDLYIDYWAAWIAPVINRDHTYERYLAANPWIHQVFPQFEPHTGHLMDVEPASDRKRLGWERWYRSPLGQRLRAVLDTWQERRLRRYQERVGQQGLVVVKPHVLRFHVPDRRVQYQHAFDIRWSDVDR